MNPNQYTQLFKTLKELQLFNKDADEQHLIAMLTEGVSTRNQGFEIGYESDGKLNIEVMVGRSGLKGNYFLDSYEARMEYKDAPENNREYIFKIHNGIPITVKEAFNLLEGRSVCKELISFSGRTYNGWLKFDFTKRDEDNQYKLMRTSPYHSFDLEKTLALYSIQELQDEMDKHSLLSALKSGDLHPVHLVLPSKTKEILIEADPWLGRIRIKTVKRTKSRSSEDFSNN